MNEKEYSEPEKITRKINIKELEGIIKELNHKESLDPTGISNKICKSISQNTKIKNLNLFNLCLEQKNLPLKWKYSIVSMLLK